MDLVNRFGTLKLIQSGDNNIFVKGPISTITDLLRKPDLEADESKLLMDHFYAVCHLLMISPTNTLQQYGSYPQAERLTTVIPNDLLFVTFN